MSLFKFLGSRNRIAYFVCSLIGLGVFLAIKPVLWASYGGLLVSYHLFVGWLLMSADKADRSLKVSTTIAYHILCVALLIASRVVLGILLHSIFASRADAADAVIALIQLRIILILQVLIAYGLAYLERDWLFSGGRKIEAAEEEPVVRAVTPPPAANFEGPLVPATSADHEEWLQSRGGNSAFYEQGMSTADDFEQWLRARGKTQHTSFATDGISAAN
jgi:hypothetical protein